MDVVAGIDISTGGRKGIDIEGQTGVCDEVGVETGAGVGLRICVIWMGTGRVWMREWVEARTECAAAGLKDGVETTAGAWIGWA